jgi:hypothetical protein
LRQAAFCLSQKIGSRRQTSNSFLQLTFATSKPLLLLALKTVAKLTLNAHNSSGQFDYVIMKATPIG